MELKIGGKDYELRFGLAFINELDNRYTVNQDGMRFGMGTEQTIMHLQMSKPIALIDVIKAATVHLKSKPSNAHIEEFIEELAEKDELDKFFDDIKEALRQSPFLRKKMEDMDNAMKDHQTKSTKK